MKHVQVAVIRGPARRPNGLQLAAGEEFWFASLDGDTWLEVNQRVPDDEEHADVLRHLMRGDRQNKDTGEWEETRFLPMKAARRYLDYHNAEFFED